MNYIEMTKQCELCRMVNDDVNCDECIDFNRCLLIEENKNGNKNDNKE